MVFAATEARDEGDGLAELCARADRELYDELHCGVLLEEAQESGQSIVY